jgi:salicylate hydroxylase
MAETPKLQIAIVGAGIAGLTAAIALKNHPGMDVQIYERASQLQEIGASIALGPNGLRTLDRLGIRNALDESIAFRNLKTRLPHIYWSVHHNLRADIYLQSTAITEQTK